MKSKKIKSIIFITFIIVITHAHTTTAFAREISLELTPPLVYLQIKPPAAVEMPITLTNRSKESLKLKIQFKPFLPANSNKGEVIYLSTKDAIPGANPLVYQRISLVDNGEPIQALTLLPNEKKTVTLLVDIPAEEKASDYYFSILFTAPPEPAEGSDSRVLSDSGITDQLTAQSVITTSLATNVLLSITSSQSQAGPPSSEAGSIEEFSTSLLRTQGPTPFTLLIKNDSSQVLIPQGTILIENIFGQTIDTIQLPSVYILAKSSRLLPLVWKEQFLVGPYNAKLLLSFPPPLGAKKHEQYTKVIHFFGFPGQLILILIAALFVVGLIVVRVRSKLQ